MKFSQDRQIFSAINLQHASIINTQKICIFVLSNGFHLALAHLTFSNCQSLQQFIAVWCIHDIFVKSNIKPYNTAICYCCYYSHLLTCELMQLAQQNVLIEHQVLTTLKHHLIQNTHFACHSHNPHVTTVLVCNSTNVIPCSKIHLC